MNDTTNTAPSPTHGNRVADFPPMTICRECDCEGDFSLAASSRELCDNCHDESKAPRTTIDEQCFCDQCCAEGHCGCETCAEPCDCK